MREIDLRIHPKIRTWLTEMVSYDPSANFEMIVGKGQTNGKGPDLWSMSAIPGDQAKVVKEKQTCIYIKADGLVFLVVQPHLVHELEGMYMDWAQDGPSLINQA